MNKYTLSFLDGFFTHNWSENYDDEEAFRNVCKSNPDFKAELEQCIDEGIDVCFSIEIITTPEGLKKEVMQKIEEYGRTVDVFSVQDEKGKTVLTEEDI